jgi:hypothetical protein
MPNGNVAESIGLSAAPNKENSVPAIGQKILLSWAKWGNMNEVPEGHYMIPNGTYVEVEVTAIKTAKVILEQ